MYGAKITGTGSCFPARALTNDELSKTVETSDEWVRERTGIRERRISEPGNPEEFNSALGLKASLKALEMAGKTPDDIDQIIYATSSPDTLVPSTACWLQAKIGANRAWSFDIAAACSGFVYGLAIADQFVRSGHVKTSLVVGAEVLSSIVNWQDRSSCILFGDGAGAAIIEQTAIDAPSRILTTHLGSDGRLAGLIQIPAGGSNIPVDAAILAAKSNKVHLLGKEVFKDAVHTLVHYAALAMKHHGYTVKDVDWFVLHQANLRIVEAVAKRLGIPEEKILVNIDRFGNTSAASIPTVMDEAVRAGRIKKGDLLLLDAFGGGATYGSALVRW